LSQIARAQLGYQDIVVRSPPELSPERRAAIAQRVRATELLYAVNERGLVGLSSPIERSTDISALAALGEITARNKDARSTLLVGKAALGRGYALEHYAFPTIGIPDYRAIGPAVDSSIVYAIARQESQFYQGDISTAKAMGLMQVTPEAGRETAKKFGAPYDVKRLLSDPVYNVQMGAGELGDLLKGYRGSYILTFAGYNAGRGRVREWISATAIHARMRSGRPGRLGQAHSIFGPAIYSTRVGNLQVYALRLARWARLLIEGSAPWRRCKLRF
jgi:soluble lytic murein transglycosylase